RRHPRRPLVPCGHAGGHRGNRGALAARAASRIVTRGNQDTWRTLAAAKPAVFTIPSRLAFVDVLARGIMADAGDDPLALATITVLLPTRRACRALRDAFLRLSGGAPTLLPRLMPLNGLDEEEALFSGFASAETLAALPPAIAPMKRQL